MGLPASVSRYLDSSAFAQGELLKKHIEQRTSTAKKAQDAYHDDQSEGNLSKALAATESLKSAYSVRGGVCEALSVKWIKLKQKEGAVGLKGANKPTADARVSALADDRRFGKAIDKHAASSKVLGGSLENLYGSYKVASGKSRSHQNQISVAASLVTGSVHSCFLLSFFCPKYDNGPHAIALYTSSGKVLGLGKHVYAFDPNEGEFKVPKNEFPQFLRDLLYEGYGAAGMNLKDFVQWPG